MREDTRREVKGVVSRFIGSLPGLDARTLESLKREKPFHAAVFSDEGLLYASQERSIVTKMGTTLFPSLAYAVARDSHRDVHCEYAISGQVDSGSLSRIERIVSDLREGGKKDSRKRAPNHSQEMAEVFESATGRSTSKRVIADLYVGDYKEGPIFLEIKSPLPNLDVCAQSKEKILLYELLKRADKGRGYLAFPYNPYITRRDYGWSITKNIIDIESELLMGEEMWDKLGGDGTYDELLALVREAAEEKRAPKTGRTQTPA